MFSFLGGALDVTQRTMLDGIAQSLLFHAQASALIADSYIITPGSVHTRMISQDLGVILDQQADQDRHQLIVHHKKGLRFGAHKNWCLSYFETNWALELFFFSTD